jgi:manganese-dependent inorganic pyrophosphatase
MEVVGFETFWSRAEELRSALENSRRTSELLFATLMVTDITTSTTLLMVCGPRSLHERIVHPELSEGIYEMKGVLSRKKQVLPLLLELI